MGQPAFVASSLLLTLLTAAGCTSDPRPPVADSTVREPGQPSDRSTAPMGDADAEHADTGPTEPCTALAAREPFGTNPEAEESFPDLEVVACDGERVTLDRLRCGQRLTLLSIGAGWCGPCREETPLLEDIHREMQAEGVQVIQLMFEDAEANPATGLFCETWVETFSLTLPVFIDPLKLSLDHFERVATPLNLILDQRGRVLWAVAGSIPADLETTLRSFLPGD